MYTVTFTLPGFTTVRREGVEVTGAFVATINAGMRVGAVEETIANHPEMDDAKNRLAVLASRIPGDPHPYVIGTDGVAGYLTVAAECVKAAGLAASGR